MLTKIVDENQHLLKMFEYKKLLSNIFKKMMTQNS